MSRADQAEQRKVNRLRLVPVALGVGLVLAIAGCGSGQIAQTAQEYSVVNGASGDVGPIAIRNARLAYPPTADGVYRRGSSAPVLLAIINSGITDDRLVSGTSPISTVDISGDTTVHARHSVYTAGFGGPVSRPSSQSALPTTPPSTPPTTPPSANQGAAVAPPTGLLSIVLRNMTQDIAPGQTARMTLLFQNAGEVTLDLPIASPGEASYTAPTTSLFSTSRAVPTTTSSASR